MNADERNLLPGPGPPKRPGLGRRRPRAVTPLVQRLAFPTTRFRAWGGAARESTHHPSHPPGVLRGAAAGSRRVARQPAARGRAPRRHGEGFRPAPPARGDETRARGCMAVPPRRVARRRFGGRVGRGRKPRRRPEAERPIRTNVIGPACQHWRRADADAFDDEFQAADLLCRRPDRGPPVSPTTPTSVFLCGEPWERGGRAWYPASMAFGTHAVAKRTRERVDGCRRERGNHRTTRTTGPGAGRQVATVVRSTQVQ